MDIKTILDAGYNLGENIYKRGRGERAQVGGESLRLAKPGWFLWRERRGVRLSRKSLSLQYSSGKSLGQANGESPSKVCPLEISRITGSSISHHSGSEAGDHMGGCGLRMSTLCSMLVDPKWWHLEAVSWTLPEQHTCMAALGVRWLWKCDLVPLL